MSNLLQGTCTTATQAPGYYNDYLNTLATCGIAGAKNAQFVGATPLQQQAFGTVTGAANAYKPGLEHAQGTYGAANAMATGQSPLTSAQPYLHGATTCLGARTSQLMNPYVHCVVNQINTLGQQNIQQNLAPQATAGAVGSGQFGSQRGAQVLGQTVANANQQILGQQANALMCGYKAAMCGAVRQATICQQAGATAANAANQGVQNLGNLAKVGACIAATSQRLGLQGVCALNKMGTTQQTILQNQQCFPLSELTKAGNLLAGKTVPTTTQKTSTMSGLGAAGSVLGGLTGLLQSNGNNPSALSNLSSLIGQGIGAVKDYFGHSNAGTTGTHTTPSASGGDTSPTYDPYASGDPYSLTYNPGGGTGSSGGVTGLTYDPGSSGDGTGSSDGGTGLTYDPGSSSGDTGLTYDPGSSDGDNSSTYARGGLVYRAAGCASAVHRGALPSRR
jgi:hypothetical protein